MKTEFFGLRSSGPQTTQPKQLDQAPRRVQCSLRGKEREPREEPCWPSLDLIMLLNSRSGQNGTHVDQAMEFRDCCAHIIRETCPPSKSQIKHLADGQCSERKTLAWWEEVDSCVLHRWCLELKRIFPNVKLWRWNHFIIWLLLFIFTPDANSKNALQNNHLGEYVYVYK